MIFPTRCISVAVAAVLLLAACDRQPVAQSPVAATLTRPTLNVEARAARITVPPAVLVERGGIPGVFVLNTEHQARFRMVRTGKILSGQVEILSGLSGGETLVAGDLREVHDGSPITTNR